MNVLSFHLLIESNHNRFFSGNISSVDDIEAIKAADAVILPQGCRESLYRLACRYCTHVFPNYDVFFEYPGKTGQDALFKKMGVPMPKTLSFQDASKFSNIPLPFSYPFVFKFSWGGEGKNVFLVGSSRELLQCLEKARAWEDQDKTGFVLQEYIPTDGRSLRVVVIDNNFYSYWRRVDDGGFYTNLARGAYIDHESSPDLQKRAVEMLRDFCGKTKINLAGFDFLFAARSANPAPLFLEINFCFRCHGLGGVDRYHLLLEQGIKQWLKNLSTPEPF
ncbi:MAG: glutathione synthase [Desulfobulbaceae bacterium]|nr:glutathione synthase [Desulfobulbaceae bacterium]